MMLYHSLAALALAALASAATPPGFSPASNTELLVSYNGQTKQNGVVTARETVQTVPTLATLQRLNGTSYAVMMIDMDIPTNTPPQTSTLLHWMQTGLTPATVATNLNTTSGNRPVFLLQNIGNTAAFASYTGPNPPAVQPVSHRYVQILVDTTNAPQTALDSLRTAAQTRQGFNADNTLRAVGLNTRVAAGNYFIVTNTSTVPTNTSSSGNRNNGSTSTGGGTTGGTSGGTSGTGSGGVNVSAAGKILSQNPPVFVLCALAVLFWGL